MADPDDQKQSANDLRLACKYGAKCYQKNPVHLQQYKHPPPKRPNTNATITQVKKKFKLNLTVKDDIKTTPEAKEKDEEKSDADEEATISKDDQQQDDKTETESKPELDDKDVDQITAVQNLGQTPKSFSSNKFIREKFLVEMPEDFYHFWDFCKALKEKCPQEALKDVGLTLVGPYDVLAGKFYDIPEQPNENYLVHWRYFFDTPECQTVLKGEDRTGHHICYFRDSPKDLPVFLVNNFAKTDGVFKVVGDNIFAAVYLYLEDLKKTGDPFKRMHVGRFQNSIRKKVEELKLSLDQRSEKIRDRDKKIVTRSFNKIGIVVPYNRRTQVGYRNLSVTNKELSKLLDDIQKALPGQRQKYLSILQGILTNVSIATDECDFGTGIELGLNILAHGVDSLNQTISRFLAISYRLMNREEFAKIAEAHMKNRKRGTNLTGIENPTTISRFLAISYRLMDREEFAKIAEAHMKKTERGTNLSVI